MRKFMFFSRISCTFAVFFVILQSVQNLNNRILFAGQNVNETNTRLYRDNHETISRHRLPIQILTRVNF